MGPFVRNEQFLHENDFLLLFSEVKGCERGTVFWNFATVFLDFGTVKNVCNCKLRNCIFYAPRKPRNPIGILSVRPCGRQLTMNEG